MGHVPIQVLKDAIPLIKQGGPAMVTNALKNFINKISLNKGTSIAGQNVLITGGTSGIGLLVAEECARRGANAVIIWDIARLDETVAHLAQMQVSSKGYKVNVADIDNVNEAAKQTLADFGHVDLLIQCAGVVSGSTLMDLSDAQIDRTLDINLRALFSVTRAFLPTMKQRNSGHIVVVSSAAGTVGPAKMTDYCASKWGARGFMESLRSELAKEGSAIKTLTVCPFYIDTGMFEGVKTRIPLLLPILKPQDVADKMIASIESGAPELFIPGIVQYATTLMRVLPTHWYDWAATQLGINAGMDDFVGRAGKK